MLVPLSRRLICQRRSGEISWLPDRRDNPRLPKVSLSGRLFTWRMSLPGHSGATAPDFHRLPSHRPKATPHYSTLTCAATWPIDRLRLVPCAGRNQGQIAIVVHACSASTVHYHH